jgi:hypothetical protein
MRERIAECHKLLDDNGVPNDGKPLLFRLKVLIEVVRLTLAMKDEKIRSLEADIQFPRDMFVRGMAGHPDNEMGM